MVVELMGGDIWIESEKGVGTKISFYLRVDLNPSDEDTTEDITEDITEDTTATQSVGVLPVSVFVFGGVFTVEVFGVLTPQFRNKLKTNR